jgi:hypothetical protein
VIKAKARGRADWFKKQTAVTWPVSQLQLTLPTAVSQAGIIQFYNYTNATAPNQRFIVGSSVFDDCDAFWYNNTTLQYSGTSGPGEELDLLVEYYAVAETLAGDSSEPELIPSELHDLIVWAAAVHAREIADETAPEAWYKNLEDYRFEYYKFCSKSRPFVAGNSSDGSRVNENTDYY